VRRAGVLAEPVGRIGDRHPAAGAAVVGRDDPHLGRDPAVSRTLSTNHGSLDNFQRAPQMRL
jgi:hypothetical protein